MRRLCSVSSAQRVLISGRRRFISATSNDTQASAHGALASQSDSGMVTQPFRVNGTVDSWFPAKGYGFVRLSAASLIQLEQYEAESARSVPPSTPALTDAMRSINVPQSSPAKEALADSSNTVEDLADTTTAVDNDAPIAPQCPPPATATLPPPTPTLLARERGTTTSSQSAAGDAHVAESIMTPNSAQAVQHAAFPAATSSRVFVHYRDIVPPTSGPGNLRGLSVGQRIELTLARPLPETDFFGDVVPSEGSAPRAESASPGSTTSSTTGTSTPTTSSALREGEGPPSTVALTSDDGFVRGVSITAVGGRPLPAIDADSRVPLRGTEDWESVFPQQRSAFDAARAKPFGAGPAGSGAIGAASGASAAMQLRESDFAFGTDYRVKELDYFDFDELTAFFVENPEVVGAPQK